MLVGGRYYVTFDRAVYGFRGECTYLLATDFKDSNFSIAVAYNKEDIRSYKLLILIEKVLIQIDMKTKVWSRIVLNHNDRFITPYLFKTVHVYNVSLCRRLRLKITRRQRCRPKLNTLISTKRPI